MCESEYVCKRRMCVCERTSMNYGQYGPSYYIVEPKWSSNAFSLAGLPQGEYVFISCFFTHTLSSTG